jgi:hypothetical protein
MGTKPSIPMMSVEVGAGLDSLDAVAAVLGGTDVDGAVVPGVVVSPPDEHPASATMAAAATIAIRFLMLALLSLGPLVGPDEARGWRTPLEKR